MFAPLKVRRKRIKRPWMLGNKNAVGRGLPLGPCGVCHAERKPLKKPGMCHGCFVRDHMGFTMTRMLQQMLEAKR